MLHPQNEARKIGSDAQTGYFYTDFTSDCSSEIPLTLAGVLPLTLPSWPPWPHRGDTLWPCLCGHLDLQGSIDPVSWLHLCCPLVLLHLINENDFDLNSMLSCMWRWWRCCSGSRCRNGCPLSVTTRQQRWTKTWCQNSPCLTDVWVSCAPCLAFAPI